LSPLICFERFKNLKPICRKRLGVRFNENLVRAHKLKTAPDGDRQMAAIIGCVSGDGLAAVAGNLRGSA
jgi:hypothetical protein